MLHWKLIPGNLLAAWTGSFHCPVCNITSIFQLNTSNLASETPSELLAVKRGLACYSYASLIGNKSSLERKGKRTSIANR